MDSLGVRIYHQLMSVSFNQQSAEWLPGPYSGGPNLTMGCPQHKQLPNRHVIHCLCILTQY